LTADNLEKHSSDHLAVLNPSYFSPAAYRIFARVDGTHGWNGLIGSSYTILHEAGTAPLGSSHSAGVPPDWVALNTQTGVLTAAAGHDTDFGYDAFRAVWRTALNYRWSGDSRSRKAMDDWKLLEQQWGQHGRLAARYHHDGSAAVSYESNALYGGVLPYFQTVSSGDAASIINDKLAPLFADHGRALRQPLNYYDNNWVWFGLALYAGQSPDLAQGVSS
ncbi:MAG TPA: glycosyl hydrolase family 8, partial [Candidatus Saccharimonadales bacterium]|nr:glycosyl hydrolase family 8 [Candidatus Saccharimonadales bacterium]